MKRLGLFFSGFAAFAAGCACLLPSAQPSRAYWHSVAQLTLTGAGCGGSCHVGCAEATNFLARAGGTTHDTDYTNLICGLVTDGVWSSFDGLWIFATDTLAHALLSLVSATYNATASGTPTFTADQGYSSSANTDFVNLTFNPSTATTPNFVQNTASFGFWGYDNVASVEAAMGQSATGVTGESNLFPKFTSNQFYTCVNSPNCGFVSNSTTQGFFTGDRINSTTIQDFRNGAQVGANVTDNSQVPENSAFKILSGLGGNVYIGKVSAAYIGGTLGTTKQGQLYSRLRTYMTAVGVP
jgi:hypothetical protein